MAGLCRCGATTSAPGRGPSVSTSIPAAGGYRREGTFLEYSKALVDRLYGWHSREPNRLTADDMTRTTFALHFYDSVLVMEKRPMKPPQSTMTGTPSF